MTNFALNHVVAQMERGIKSSRPLIPPQILAEDLPLYVTINWFNFFYSTHMSS